MITALIFLGVIAVLVLSHEFGHFIVAKWKGMRVDEFGFGFPPRVFGRKFGETVYSVNLLPFGGFVRVWGEDASVETAPESGFLAEEKQNFARRSARDRFLVLVAGVAMNMLLAYVIFTIAHAMGYTLHGGRWRRRTRVFGSRSRNN
jgi:regulator of sigma E protease